VQIFLYIICGIPIAFLFLHTLIRVIRKIYKFPIPQAFADLIDNPLRRKIQPPDATAIRHGIGPGMTVLDVGPGNGRYTIGAARRVGDHGKIIAIDIEPKMIARVRERAAMEGVSNIDARVADVYELPFEDATFDLIYMIAVISEILEPIRAMQEFYRVLKPDGSLVFSELLFDPDYPLVRTLTRWAEKAGFRVKRKVGNFFYYTLSFEKSR
jgi:ubiquinone/menaquinone biosynthesis C-methylase UbiE